MHARRHDIPRTNRKSPGELDCPRASATILPFPPQRSAQTSVAWSARTRLGPIVGLGVLSWTGVGMVLTSLF